MAHYLVEHLPGYLEDAAHIGKCEIILKYEFVEELNAIFAWCDANSTATHKFKVQNLTYQESPGYQMSICWGPVK